MTQINFEELTSTIRKRMAKYRDHSEWEDAVQEATIRAWRDVESGMDDYNYIVNRAHMWGRAYMFDDTKQATGDLGRERLGIRQKRGDVRREKISMYVQEYTDLHGQEPSHRQVARALGMNDSSVWHHRKVLREHNNSVLIREEHGKNRLNRSAYKAVPLNGDSEDNANSYFSEEVEQATSVESFEEGFLGSETFFGLISDLDTVAKSAMVMFFCYGFTYPEIGEKLYGSDTYVGNRSWAQRLIRKSLTSVKHGLEGTKPEPVAKEKPKDRWGDACKNGHPRTKENTYVSPNGRTRRCRACQRKGGTTGPKRGTHCGKGHEFTEENTLTTAKGRECRQCRADRRKNNAASN